jgi:hypothetical protein
MNLERVYNFLLPAIILLMIVLGSTETQAQTKATATIDSSDIQIGQQTSLTLSIQYLADRNKPITVKWPEIGDTLRKEIDVVQQSKIDTIIDKNDPNLITQTKKIYITSFDSGYWAIPPFKFIADDTAGTYTEPLLLQVNSVVVDTTKAFKDIKSPYEKEYTFWDWIKDYKYFILISLSVILLLILLIIFIIRKLRAKPQIVIAEPPPAPPHVIALDKLEQLKNEQLWQAGKIKLYHSKLSEIIREYIENRFKIQAQEQTTDEILYGFRNVAIDQESKSKLKQLLILADLVKFAKEQPLPNENEMSMNFGVEFINGTKKEIEQAPGVKSQESRARNQESSFKN